MDSGVGSGEVEHKKIGESEVDYIKRLRETVESQCTKIQDLIARNGIMAEALGKANGIPVGSLKQGLEEKYELLECANSEKNELESKASMYRHITSQQESVLNSALKAIIEFGDEEEEPSSDANIGAEVTAENDSETEVNRLLVLVAQEQRKVERLSERVVELGGDVEELFEGIGYHSGLLEEDIKEENKNNCQGEELEDFSKYFEIWEKNEDDDAELLDDDEKNDEDPREENEDDEAEILDVREKNDEDPGEENEDDEAEILDVGEKNDEDPGEENEDDETRILDEGENNEDDIELLEEEIEEVGERWI